MYSHNRINSLSINQNIHNSQRYLNALTMKKTTNYPIRERNELLLAMFTTNGFDAQLVGDLNQPAIVIEGKYAIAGYVHNKLYHFCDQAFGGTEIFTIQLSENPSISRAKILDLIEKSTVRKLYKIKSYFDQHSMWFANHRNGNIYFSPDDVRYYFSYKKASDDLEMLQLRGFESKIVSGEVS